MKLNKLVLGLSGALFLSPFLLGAVASPASAASSSDTVSAGQTIRAQSDEDYQRGYRQGYRDGWNQAKDDCKIEHEKGYLKSSPNDDYSQGYDDGFQKGYSRGFAEYCQ